jgi:hypothetical protein
MRRHTTPSFPTTQGATVKPRCKPFRRFRAQQPGAQTLRFRAYRLASAPLRMLVLVAAFENPDVQLIPAMDFHSSSWQLSRLSVRLVLPHSHSPATVLRTKDFNIITEIHASFNISALVGS